jgi:beta-glucosidase-like glycosyl hydrolase
MGRSAYSGRNWEGFSPDPYLSGVTMEKSVRGLQDAGVQATAKHWLLNEQEILRNPVRFPNGTLQYEALSSNVDDRTVRECLISLKLIERMLTYIQQMSFTCGLLQTLFMLMQLHSCAVINGPTAGLSSYSQVT